VVVFAAFFDAVCCLASSFEDFVNFCCASRLGGYGFLHFVRAFPPFSLHFSGVPPLFFEDHYCLCVTNDHTVTIIIFKNPGAQQTH